MTGIFDALTQANRRDVKMLCFLWEKGKWNHKNMARSFNWKISMNIPSRWQKRKMTLDRAWKINWGSLTAQAARKIFWHYSIGRGPGSASECIVGNSVSQKDLIVPLRLIIETRSRIRKNKREMRVTQAVNCATIRDVWLPRHLQDLSDMRINFLVRWLSGRR